MRGSADSRSAEWSHAGWSSAGSCGVEMIVRVRVSAGVCGCGHGVELGVNGAE